MIHKEPDRINAVNINTVNQPLIGLVLFLFLCIGAAAATEPPVQAMDSSTVYQDIETFSRKNKFTRILYGMIFKPITPVQTEKKRRAPIVPYARFEGKIIKSIVIDVSDPFGVSVLDTGVTMRNALFTAGNALHVKTQNGAIRNILLFHENTPLDSLLVKESQRLIRSQSFVHHVSVQLSSAGDPADSVEVRISIVDKWSFLPMASVVAPRVKGGFTENNFAGFGHQLNGEYARNTASGTNGFEAAYAIAHIRNTRIGAKLHYHIDENDYFDRGIDVQRPFNTALSQWLGGITLAQRFQKLSYLDSSRGLLLQNLRYNSQDYWAGNAIGFLRGNHEEARFSKIVYAGRYAYTRYAEKPDVIRDSLHRFTNEQLFLGGIGIIRQRFYQDSYIYNFGEAEDVPVGKVYSFTGGWQTREESGRPYVGAQLSLSNYHWWGYLSSTMEYGTFFLGSRLHQGVVNVDALYFSNLFLIRNWHIREFFKMKISWGINREAYDSLSISGENGIPGFDAALQGSRKIIMTIQTQSYTPWHIFGFRFGPYLSCSLGILGDASTGFSKSSMYSQYGLGTLINNGLLILNTFQLSLAYYPSIPGQGYDIFKINAFLTTDLGFGEFSLGKPAVATFR